MPTPIRPLERARHFRFRAEELRAIASEWIDSGTREVLGRVAKDYDHMAELWEKQASSGLVEDCQRPAVAAGDSS